MNNAKSTTAILGIAFVLLSAIVLAPALATPTPTKTHTLVIKQEHKSTGYSVTVSGSITLTHTESSDAVSGDTVSGRVGGYPWKKTNDSRDVIKFTGKLLNFEYDTRGKGNIDVILDGKEVPPNSLVSTPTWTPTPQPTKTPTRTPTARPTPTEMETEVATPTTTPTDTATNTPAPTETDTRAPTTEQPEGGSGGLLNSDFMLGFAIGLAALVVFFAWQARERN